MYKRIVCCYEDLGIREILCRMVYIEIQDFNLQIVVNEKQMETKEKLLTFSQSGVTIELISTRKS